MRSARALLPGLLAALAAACGGGGASAPAPEPRYTLSVVVSGDGSVAGDPVAAGCSSGSCSSDLAGGTVVTLTPAPSTGAVFSGWSGACAGSGTCTLDLTSDRSVTAAFSAIAPPGPNVLPLTVNGATCGSGRGAYPNEPCVRVTVCLPGTSTCEVVDDLLVDTGSYGLRIFHEVLPFSLPRVTSAGGTLAECIQYLDGSSHWGPVATADVVLGGEPKIRIPIQVIDSTFGPAPAGCPTPEASAAAAGFKGILGVGLFAEDCGSGCASFAANGIYFACSGGTCGGVAVPVANQVPNPVARLQADGNGVVVDLPPVQLGGQLSADGALLLGIDTRSNNASAGATAYPVDPATGDLRTSFDGSTGGGFLDTGSNGLFFAPPRSGLLPACRAPDAAWYCPTHAVGLTATNAGSSGTPSGTVSFAIGFATGLLGTANSVFPDLGGPAPPGAGFDFGLPFFLGQRVFVGIEGKASSLGTGPYFGY